MYIVKMMSKEEFLITEEEFKQIARSRGEIFIPSIGVWLNKSSISVMYPQERANRETQNIGYLHDGTRVIRQFGQWMCDNGQYDASGRLQTRPDPAYYPEVAEDRVANIAEWTELGTGYYSLPREYRPKLEEPQKILSTVSELNST